MLVFFYIDWFCYGRLIINGRLIIIKWFKEKIGDCFIIFVDVFFMKLIFINDFYIELFFYYICIIFNNWVIVRR